MSKINKLNSDWWRNTIIYHVYLPSFKDSNDDGIGDFPGLTSKLDYLTSLGVDTLMIGPFFPSPMFDNGYDVSNFCDVDPIYGTMNDFDLFMTTAKKKGLNIILDFPINHTSSSHEWFLKSIDCEEPYKDYYIWADAKGEMVPPNNWISVFGGSAWLWNASRQQYYFHQFLAEQPDLNLRNPLVKEEIEKILEFWLDKGIDGFRVDAASHLFEDEKLQDEPLNRTAGVEPNEYDYLRHIHTKGHPDNLVLVQEWRELLNKYENKDGKYRLLLVEVTEPAEDSAQYYGTTNKPLADVPFNFSLTKLNAHSTGRDLHKALTMWLNLVPAGMEPNWILGNHDLPRVASNMGKTMSSGLHMVVLLLPGVVFSYYGDELGMENTAIEHKEMKDSFALRTKPENSRDPCRTPMQWNTARNAGFSTSKDKLWLPVHENFEKVNVEVQRTLPTSCLQIYLKLTNLRKEPCVQEGKVLFPLVDGNVFSMLRVLRGHKSLLVIVNLGLCACVADFNKCPVYLPEEAQLEVTNNAYFERKADCIDLDSDFPVCCRFSTAYRDKTTNEWRLKLDGVFLLPKEAMVVSFTSE